MYKRERGNPTVTVIWVIILIREHKEKEIKRKIWFSKDKGQKILRILRNSKNKRFIFLEKMKMVNKNSYRDREIHNNSLNPLNNGWSFLA